MAYDKAQKARCGENFPIPTQEDFLKLKIEEKERILARLIEEGKQEMLVAHLQEVEQKTWDNPYERVVRRLQLRQ